MCISPDDSRAGVNVILEDQPVVVVQISRASDSPAYLQPSLRGHDRTWRMDVGEGNGLEWRRSQTRGGGRDQWRLSCRREGRRS